MIPAPRARRILPWLARLLLLAGTLEGMAAIALHELKVNRGIRFRVAPPLLSDQQRAQIASFVEQERTWYQSFDSELGWRNSPGASSPGFTQSEQGLRSRRIYASEPPPGTIRIAAFGDSFVHGDEVADDAVWSARVEATHPNLEVLNFGVSGYGVDQAYLRYLRDGRNTGARIVLVGFLADDLYRNVNVFRPFLSPGTSQQLAKPRFRLEEGRLRLIPNPLARLQDYRRLLSNPEEVLLPLQATDAFFPDGYEAGPFDFLRTMRLVKISIGEWHRRRTHRLRYGEGFETNSEAFQTTVALLEAFQRAIAAADAHPLIVFFPDKNDLRAIRAGSEPSYAPLERELRSRSIDFEDLRVPFQQEAGDQPIETLFHEVHYSERGNAIFAKWIVRRLMARAWLPTED